VGAISRLRYVDSQLFAAARIRNIEDAMNAFFYHMENYFARVYELLDRAIKLIAKATGTDPKEVGAIKNAKRRPQVAQALKQRLGRRAALLAKLVDLLEEDVLLRHGHTHDTFLAVGLHTGDDVFEPADVLMQLQGRPERKKIVGLLRRELRRIAKEHADRIDQIANVADKIADDCRAY
jgi:hypothetical protein